MEDEQKQKSDIVKARKLAEDEVAGLHEDLDNAEKTIHNLNATVGKQQKAYQELQMALEDANKGSENLKTALLKSEKKVSTLSHEKEDAESSYERSERQRKVLENERSELQTQLSTVESQVLFLSLYPCRIVLAPINIIISSSENATWKYKEEVGCWVS